MTLIFGSTLCYAAEAESMGVQNTRSVQEYSDSSTMNYSCSAYSGVTILGNKKFVLVDVTVKVYYKWTEGTYAYFTGGDVIRKSCTDRDGLGGTYTVQNAGMSISGNNIVFSFGVYRDDTQVDSFSISYGVDEYGQVY